MDLHNKFTQQVHSFTIQKPHYRAVLRPNSKVFSSLFVGGTCTISVVVLLLLNLYVMTISMAWGIFGWDCSLALCITNGIYIYRKLYLQSAYMLSRAYLIFTINFSLHNLLNLWYGFEVAQPPADSWARFAWKSGFIVCGLHATFFVIHIAYTGLYCKTEQQELYIELNSDNLFYNTSATTLWIKNCKYKILSVGVGKDPVMNIRGIVLEIIKLRNTFYIIQPSYLTSIDLDTMSGLTTQLPLTDLITQNLFVDNGYIYIIYNCSLYRINMRTLEASLLFANLETLFVFSKACDVGIWQGRYLLCLCYIRSDAKGLFAIDLLDTEAKWHFGYSENITEDSYFESSDGLSLYLVDGNKRYRIWFENKTLRVEAMPATCSVLFPRNKLVTTSSIPLYSPIESIAKDYKFNK
eukprot:TRINITY_DN3019_c0_g3_i1.p1 TRINITY_DN3019_c0_g3~~TRINITY_DN3019_c0_g3_i1.p1  ORF type:complete len:447 (+),score=5.70 TRINITY_DN3019_c0_g3_i1:117-1343(+)